MSDIVDEEDTQDHYKSTETKSEIKLNFSSKNYTSNVDQTMESADFANVSQWGKYSKATGDRGFSIKLNSLSLFSNKLF